MKRIADSSTIWALKNGHGEYGLKWGLKANAALLHFVQDFSTRSAWTSLSSNILKYFVEPKFQKFRSPRVPGPKSNPAIGGVALRLGLAESWRQLSNRFILDLLKINDSKAIKMK